MSQNDTAAGVRDGSDPPEQFVAMIERYQHAPDECTIFSSRKPDVGVARTEWVSATEGSYVRLDVAR